MNHTEPETSTAELLDRAIDIEKKAARLYGEFAKIFPEPPDLTAFWHDLVKDEAQHLKLLLDLKERLTGEQLVVPADPKIWNNITDALRLLGNDPLKKINTLDDAYELTHELEFSEVNAVFLFLLEEYELTNSQLEFARDEIVRHQAKLLNFSLSFGDRIWRKGILPRR